MPHTMPTKEQPPDKEGGAAPMMHFGSAFGGLFGSGGADPREYCGPPNPRRCATPADRGNHVSSHTSRSPTHTIRHASSSAHSSTQRSRSSDSTPTGRLSCVQRCMRIYDDRSDDIARHSTAAEIGDRHEDRQQGSGSGGPSDPPQLNLESLDLEMDVRHIKEASDVLIDSPRSVEACLRLGLCPLDFFAASYDQVVKHMKDAGEDITDDAVCRMRYSYLVQRAKQKYVAACEERVQIMVEEGAAGGGSQRGNNRHPGTAASSSGGEAADSSTRIVEEEKRLAKIVENNKNRLRQQLLHHQLVEKQREREEQRKEAQRRADEAQRKSRLREMIERSKKEEEAQALRNEARELERQEQQRRVELKRATYEAKDRQVKDRIVRQRMEAEAENEAKRLLNVERQRQMREQGELLALERRAEFQRRNEVFEASQREYKHQLDVKREEHKAISRLKQKKIMDAIQRSNDQQAAKVHRALEKERAADEVRKQQAAAAAEQLRIKNERDEERERERQQVIHEAQLRQKERVDQLEEKIATTEQHMDALNKQRASEARVRSEIQRQKELDKSDCVTRSKFVDEYRIAKIDRANREKIARVERLQHQQEILKHRRKLHRQEAERSRVKIQEVTPGPTDFIVTEGNIGTVGPRWKMGLPASALGMQVVMKHVPAASYYASPGPCVYQYEQIRDARHRRPEAFSLMQHDRWKAQSEAARTPGPSDYAPASPPVQRSRPSSSLM